MFYIMSGKGQLIEQGSDCPTEAYLRELADECNLDELWVIDGEHSGITYERHKPKRKIVFGRKETYPL